MGYGMDRSLEYRITVSTECYDGLHHGCLQRYKIKRTGKLCACKCHVTMEN